jgi:hypothetical protein
MTTLNIQEVLKGVRFPTVPSDIRENARRNGAANEMMALLDKLPEKSYKNLSDINHSLGQIEDRGEPIG